MLSIVLAEVQEVQIPLLSAMLLGACATKFSRILRVGSLDAGLGPTALFPMGLRRPVASAMCIVELCCGIGLLVTAGQLGRGEPANTIRLATAVLFLVATCALIELRTSHPETGCGCFGDFSTSPVSGRTVARSALLAAAALATIGLPPLHPPHRGAEAGRLLGILVAEVVVLAALSPELGEGLVRLGYSEPCELRRLPTVRTLTALRRSSQWRQRAGLITTDVPADMWRELCWRFVVFPARAADREAEVVFAVYLRPHRPAIHAALVDAVTGEVLAWPALPTRRAGPGWSTQPEPAAPGLAAPGLAAPDLAAPGLAVAEPAAPEPAVPGLAEPEPAAPEPAAPEPAEPGLAVPEPAAPEPAKPDLAEPEPAKREPAEPDLAVPEPAAAEPAKPDLAVPKPAAPDLAVPKPAEPEPAKPRSAKPVQKPAQPRPAKPVQKPAQPRPAKPVQKPAKPKPAAPDLAVPKPAKPKPAAPAPDRGGQRAPDLVGSGVLAAPTDPGLEIPAYRDPSAPRSDKDLALYRDL